MEKDLQTKINVNSNIYCSDLEQIKEDRTNFKLSLRKKKCYDILAKKRIYPPIPSKIFRPYEFNFSKLNLPSYYKIIFAKEEELIKTALESMKSDDIITVTYGVCLLKSYLSNFLDNVSILKNLNLTFVSDILNMLEKYCEKKELRIVYNLLYILTNYSYVNDNKLITNILLSSKGYRVWELCFDMQDYEIMSQMIWILHNITYKNGEGSYNLIKSNFFRNKIFSFYSNEIIMRHMNEKNSDDIFYIIIDNGICLLANLILLQFPSSYDQKDKYNLCFPLFDLLLKYSMSNSEKIYNCCIYAISLAIDENLDLLQGYDDNNNVNIINLLNSILSKKFFSNEKLVINSNRILGNFISMKSGLSEEFYTKCIQYEFDIVFGIKSELAIKESYWVLSNILHDYQKAAFIICNNIPFLDKTMTMYQNLVKINDIKEMIYFIRSLVSRCNIEDFIKLQDRGVVDITMKFSKEKLNNANSLITLLELIDTFLFIGESVKDNFKGKNLIKEKCDNYGLKELLEEYENTDNEKLYDIIDKINRDYYSNDENNENMF